MKWATAIIAVLLIVGGFFLLNNPSQQDNTSTQALSADTKIYDVRTPQEFANGHTKGAESLPLAEIEDGKLPEVDKNSPIAVYCRSGNRSAQAKSLLEKAGFSNVKDLGGLSDLASYDILIVQN